MLTLFIKLIGVEDFLELRDFTDEKLEEFAKSVANKGIYIYNDGDLRYNIVCSNVVYYLTEPQVEPPSIEEYYGLNN